VVPGAKPTIDAFHACVLALVTATPPGQTLPHAPDHAISAAVADAATRALRPPAAAPATG